MANSGTEINFPSDFAPQETKNTKEWNKQYQQAIWSAQSRGLGIASDDWVNRVINLKREGQGNSDIDKFKSILINDGNTAFMNLAWDVSTPIPTYVENIVGQYMNQGYRVDCVTLNPESQTEYDRKKRELEFKKFLVENQQQLPAFQNKLPKQDDPEVFESQEEIELHLDLNWKQSECLAMESAIQYVHRSNDEDEIKKQMVRDLVEVGFCAKRVEFDSEMNIKECRVDPLNFLSSRSRRDDFTDVKYIGEIIYYTIDDLAEITDFTEEELADIAKSSQTQNGNGAWNSDWERKYYPTDWSHNRPYGDFTVKIVEAEYYSYDDFKYEKIPTKKGNGFYFQRVQNGEVKSEKNEVVTKRIKVIYRSKWVVNTDYIFDYGLKENMVRNKIKGAFSEEPPLFIQAYMPNNLDMKNKSIVEKMLPYSNQICVMQLKAMQLIAKMRPNGVAVDVASIAGAIAGLGEKNFTARDMQSLYEQTGNYYYSSMTEDGRNLNNQQPVRELPESLMGGLQQIVAMTNHYLQQLELVTGVPISTIGSPDKDALVGIEKMKTLNRNNSTRFIENAYKNVLGRSSKIISLMVQDGLKMGRKAEDYAMAIGNHNVDILEISKKVELADYGIFINVLPDALEQAQLEQQINTALAAGTIKQSDAMKVRRIGRENIELAERYMDIYERKYEEIKLRQATAASEAQARAQAESAALIEREKRDTLLLEWEQKNSHLALEYALKGQESSQDFTEEAAIENLKARHERALVILASQQQEKLKQSEGSKTESMAGSFPAASGTRQPKIPQGGSSALRNKAG